MRTALFALLMCVFSVSVAAQPTGTLELRGAAGQRRVVTMAEIAAMPHRDVTASAHKVSGRFSGVSLGQLLRLVGAPAGDSLKGAALASYVLVEAADGYRVTFALAELNESFTDRLVLVVDSKDGKALGDRDGPLQLIVPDEKRPGRWVRQLRRISVVSVPTPSR